MKRARRAIAPETHALELGQRRLVHLGSDHLGLGGVGVGGGGVAGGGFLGGYAELGAHVVPDLLHLALGVHGGGGLVRLVDELRVAGAFGVDVLLRLGSARLAARDARQVEHSFGRLDEVGVAGGLAV